MTAYAAKAQYVPKSNGAHMHVGVLTLAQNLASADTLTVTVPDGVPADAFPSKMEAWHLSSGTTWIPCGPDVANKLVLTNHNRATGVTTLTAGSGGLSAGDKVHIIYVDHGPG